MARKHLTPVCRSCGHPGTPRKCSKCGRLKCDGCVKWTPYGGDCEACRLGLYAVFFGISIRLRVGDNNVLYSSCGEISRNTPVTIEYLVPEAVEEAGRLRYELDRKGFHNITILEKK